MNVPSCDPTPLIIDDIDYSDPFSISGRSDRKSTVSAGPIRFQSWNVDIASAIVSEAKPEPGLAVPILAAQWPLRFIGKTGCEPGVVLCGTATRYWPIALRVYNSRNENASCNQGGYAREYCNQ